MSRVLITDYVHPALISRLREQGYHAQYMPEVERPQLLEWIPDCVGIVVNTKVIVDTELLDKAGGLKWVGRLGSGLDTIDTEACRARGIEVISTPEANANAVAEHVFGMVLALMRNIAVADREVRHGVWNREGNRGRELQGRTIGIIGFGNTGGAFAQKCAGWNVRVLGYDKYKTAYADHLEYVTECTLEKVFAEADIISLHVPLTTETRYMVDGAFINRCRPGVILINSARGKVLRLDALLDALETGHVGGACLDVVETEKLSARTAEEQVIYAKLASYQNVVLTPHIAGWTFESKERIAIQIATAVQKLPNAD